MEDHLYHQLKKFNETIHNPYKQAWGSALSYVDPAMKVNGKEYDEVDLNDHLNMALEEQKAIRENYKTQR